ncbi:hypothetical protein Dsin_016391 [Dipteronia sinensis]|uniref:Uncharacterized protein n=1 Tax=Dipteronia sinensis TaxID=43782 RepID=A0AAE0E5Y6_9ROSI|nr:hypothetical protein Dsin_016391 [Dipteronia sinensis]
MVSCSIQLNTDTPLESENQNTSFFEVNELGLFGVGLRSNIARNVELASYGEQRKSKQTPESGDEKDEKE